MPTIPLLRRRVTTRHSGVHEVRPESLARPSHGQARDLLVPEPCLVHGRLDADNLLWDGRGRLVSVLGRDRAQLFDPALDAAWLFAQQWDPRRAGADREQMRRTRIWVRTLGLEPLARAILGHKPEEHLAYQVGNTIEWLDQTTGW
ncbi:phosphotransferase [Streptomyces sp. NPDC000405]|uniref:phosphotransferase n=1 Tax=Streptomyces sp. NPDC000405 TaxID=3161033 RepID=UPI00398D3094